MSKVAVLGAGSWGTALSIVLADNKHDVRLWSHRQEQVDEINEQKTNSRYLPDITLPDNLHAYANIEAAIQDVAFILLVVPTSAMREVCQKIKDTLPQDVTIVHASKGVEPDSLKRDRKSTRLNSSHVSISYAVFCLKKKNANRDRHLHN